MTGINMKRSKAIRLWRFGFKRWAIAKEVSLPESEVNKMINDYRNSTAYRMDRKAKVGVAVDPQWRHKKWRRPRGRKAD